MSKKKHVLQRIIGAFGDFFAWVRETLSDDEVRAAIYADLGLDPVKAKEAPAPDFAEQQDSIDRYRKTVDPDAAAFAAAVADIKAIYTAISSSVEAAKTGTSEATEEIVHRLLRVMSLSYFRLRLPVAFWLGQAFGFGVEAFSSELREPVGKGIVGFVSSPGEHFARIYGDNWAPESEEQARQLSHAILAPLAVALGFWEKTLYKLLELANLGVKLPPRKVLYGWDPAPGSTTPVADRLDGRTLSFAFTGVKPIGPGTPQPADPCATPEAVPPDATLEGSLSFALLIVPGEHGGPGLLVAAGGGGALSVPFGDGWLFKLEIKSASAVDFFIRDWTAIDVGGPSDASLSVTLERPPDALGQPFSLGLGDGASLEFERFSLMLGLVTGGPTARLLFHKGALVIARDSNPVVERAGGAGPGDQLRIDVELALGFAGGQFYIEGGGALRATLPVGRKLGPLSIQSITAALTPSTSPGTPDLSLEASTTLIVKLGPVTFTVDRIGFAAALVFWDSPELGFKAPNGIGIAVAAEAVTGGGFLFYDKANDQYAGVLDLAFKGLFTARAIAVLTTRLPDGRKGFSFLAILAIEDFTPIELGLGFRITGLGGIFGYDRTVNTEALERGLKNRTLDRIMFPPDPIANAAAIVSAVSAVFPPARDQLVIGPMAQISWGADSLVTIELALALELPTPARLVFMGKLRAFFPHREAPAVKIQVDLIGWVDFDRKELFAHAVLVESKLAGFTLAGAAALLLRWGDDPTFVLSFGGFNKRYEDRLPAGFPKLERLSVPLTRGNNPRLKLDAYVAVTSNSFQIGGRLELFAKKGKFSIEGWLQVDALFQSGQPCFIFDLDAKFQLKAFGESLFAVSFKGTFSGNRPYQIQGKATFEIWIFDYSVSVDHSFGSADGPPALPPADVRGPLLAALRDPRSWRAGPPTDGLSVVTLRAPGATEEIMLHPLGTLAVSQRVAPLGLPLSRFGSARPRGPNQFRIGRATVQGAEVTISPLNEQFARAQFFEMSEDEKLSGPAFEQMQAGVQLGAGAIAHGPAVAGDMEYETLVYNKAAGSSAKAERYTLSAERLAVLAHTGSAAVFAPLRTKYQGPPRQVRLAWQGYRVGSTDDLSTRAIPGAAGEPQSYTAAAVALRAHLAAHPEERGQLQLVAAWRDAEDGS